VSEKLKIGISIGDVNGIGLEVIIKTLVDNHIYEYFTPIVYGHTKVASFHRRTVNAGELNFNVINNASQAQHRKPNMINCWEEDVKIDLGTINETGGKYALLSLQRATADLVSGEIDALVTAPINLVVKIGEKVQEEADKQLYDLPTIQQKLIQLQKNISSDGIAGWRGIVEEVFVSNNKFLVIIRCKEKPSILFVPEFIDHHISQSFRFVQILNVSRGLKQFDQSIGKIRVVFYISI